MYCVSLLVWEMTSQLVQSYWWFIDKVIFSFDCMNRFRHRSILWNTRPLITLQLQRREQSDLLSPGDPCSWGLVMADASSRTDTSIVLDDNDKNQRVILFSWFWCSPGSSYSFQQIFQVGPSCLSITSIYFPYILLTLNSIYNYASTLSLSHYAYQKLNTIAGYLSWYSEVSITGVEAATFCFTNNLLKISSPSIEIFAPFKPWKIHHCSPQK